MIVTKDTWHARLYLSWYRRKFKKEIEKWEQYEQDGILQRMMLRGFICRSKTPERVNLCPYVRIVLFWSWLRWLLIDGTIGSFRVAWASWVSWAGFWIIILTLQPLTLIVEVLISVISIAGFIILVLAILDDMGRHGQIRFKEKTAKSPSQFVQVLNEYFIAIHDRICPFIEIRK